MFILIAIAGVLSLLAGSLVMVAAPAVTQEIVALMLICTGAILIALSSLLLHAVRAVDRLDRIAALLSKRDSEHAK